LRGCHDIAHDEIVSMRGDGPFGCEPAGIKKSGTSGLFWGLASHNMADRFSAGRH
jgi:hypothetical protein